MHSIHKYHNSHPPLLASSFHQAFDSYTARLASERPFASPSEADGLAQSAELLCVLLVGSTARVEEGGTLGALADRLLTRLLDAFPSLQYKREVGVGISFKCFGSFTKFRCCIRKAALADSPLDAVPRCSTNGMWIVTCWAAEAIACNLTSLRTLNYENWVGRQNRVAGCAGGPPAECLSSAKVQGRGGWVLGSCRNILNSIYFMHLFYAIVCTRRTCNERRSCGSHAQVLRALPKQLRGQ